MKQLKSWFFSTVRGLNSRGKFINLADFGEPDQVTFTDLLDTALTKKVDASNYQDQADINDINARLDGDKFVNPAGLPDFIILPGIPLTIITNPATLLTPRHVYNIGVTYADNTDITNRVTDKLVNPSNLPVVEADSAPGNIITVTSATSGGFTTYKVFANPTPGDFVLKSGDTMTGTLFVTSLADPDRVSTIFAGGYVFDNAATGHLTEYDNGVIGLRNDNINQHITLNVFSNVLNSSFIEASNYLGKYFHLDNAAPLLAGVNSTHSRLYGIGGSLRFRKVGQSFDTQLIFNSTLNRTIQFPDASGTVALTTSFRISALLAANASNTIDNADFNQTWRWLLTTPTSIGLNITETAPSLGGSGSQHLVKIATLASSSADPLVVQAGGVDAFKVFASGQISMGVTGFPTAIYGKTVIQNDFSYIPYTDNISVGAVNDYPVVNQTHIIFTSAVTSITGFTAPSPATSKILILTNASPGTILLVEEDLASVATNRIKTTTGIDVSIVMNGTATLLYDTGISRWRITSAGASSPPASQADVDAGIVADQFVSPATLVNATTVVHPSRTININGVTQDLSTNKEWRTSQADTGALTYAGMIAASATTVDIGPLTGIVVDNETDPNNPVFTYINYPGALGVTIPTIGSGQISYLLMLPDGFGSAALVWQNTFPTSAQRKTHIYASKASHPNLVSIGVVGNETDYSTSPNGLTRDFFQSVNYVNNGIRPFASAADLTFATTAGKIIGNGINFYIDRTNPNEISRVGTNITSFFIRTQTGGATGAVTSITPAVYDVGGVITAVPAGTNNSTIQYVYAVPFNGQIGFTVLLGQTVYATLAEAITAVGKETFTVFPNLINNAILIGFLCLRNTATNLTDLTFARFIRADIFGQVSGGGGGTSVSTVQNVYNNSGAVDPQLLTSVANGSLKIRRGSTADTDNVLALQNGSGITTFAVTGNGLINAGSLFLLDTTYKEVLNVSALDNLRLGLGFPTLSITSGTINLISTGTIQINGLGTGGLIIQSSTVAQSVTLRTVGDANACAGIINTLTANATNAGTTNRAIVTVSGTYRPTSGTANFRGINIINTIEEIAPAISTTTLIDIQPTLTAIRGVIYGIRIRIPAAPTGGGIGWSIFSDGIGFNALVGKTAHGSTNTPTALVHLAAGTAAVNTAPVKLTPGVNLTLAEGGTLEYDGNNFFITEASLQRKSIPGVIYSQTAYKTIANTITETTILNTAITLPANFFKAGKGIRFDIAGFHSTTASPTIRFRVKLGATTILDTGAATAGINTNDQVELKAGITCYTTGVGGTFSAQGLVREFGTGGTVLTMTNIATTVIDTTIALTLDVTIEWGTASASNTITFTDGSIEIRN